jgi:hypothetical protein
VTSKISDFLVQLRTNAIARHRWLMPAIVATQEAEIRRIMVQSKEL